MNDSEVDLAPPKAAPPRLRMEGITKNFGGVHALEGVTLEARAGEVHALCGENGAGKSTLMKILAGAITDYDGRDPPGRQARRRSPGPRDAEDAGIRIIYQELNLVPDLSVAANIFLGREKTGALRLARRPGDGGRGPARCSTGSGRRSRPRARVGDLRIGDQQMVEIAKALAFDAAILIMDEPTSALSDAEVARLFRVIDDLRKARGDDPLHLAQDERGVHPGRRRDRPPRRPVRRHRRRGPRPTPDQVVRWMVGREIAELHFEPHAVDRQARCSRSRASACRARPAAAGRRSRDLTFDVDGRRGRRASPASSARAGPSCSKPSSAPARRPPAGTILLDGQPARFREPGRGDRGGRGPGDRGPQDPRPLRPDDRRREHHDPPPRRPDPRRPGRPRGRAPGRPPSRSAASRSRPPAAAPRSPASRAATSRSASSPAGS